MKIKKKLMFLVLILILMPIVFSLQEIAGPLQIKVPRGGTNSTVWGLMSDLDFPVNVTIKVEVNDTFKEYINVPEIYQLEPQKTNWVNVSVTIPQDWDMNNTKFDGYLFAKLAPIGNVTSAAIYTQVGKQVFVEIYEPLIPPESENLPISIPLLIGGLVGLGAIIFMGIKFFLTPK